MSSPRKPKSTRSTTKQIVVDNPSLERDPRSNAILNRSASSYGHARSRKMLSLTRTSELETLKSEMVQVKTELAKIQALLAALT